GEEAGVLRTRNIKWNVSKFLVDRHGQVLRRYGSPTKPHTVRKESEGALKAQAAPLATKDRIRMIALRYGTTPNGLKITLSLAEAGLPYKIIPVNSGKGDQFQPEFLQVAPNNRIPAIVDHAPADGASAIPVFESGAILLYLAEKTGRFIPDTLRG